MFPLPQAPRLIGRGSISADCKLDSSSQDPQIGNKWKELRTPTRGEIEDNIFCRHANCGCNLDEGYGLFGMVEQQHSDILSALARDSQEDSRGEEILPRFRCASFPHTSSYILIFPSCFLMDTFHEAVFQSEFCSPTNRSKTISTCRKPQGQPNCGVPNGCADWRSELGQLAIDMLRISMCHLKVGECSNTFH